MKKLNCISTIKQGLYLFLLLSSLVSCKSEYHQYVERELASGVTQDSLIFDMRIGQSRMDFYGVCWDLNSRQVVSHSPDNQSVQYFTDRDSLGNNTDDTKEMRFYGIFDEQQIMRGMDMTYSYPAWAPWNEDKQSDDLLVDLREEYEAGYPGNDFIDMDLKGIDGPVLVKIDGNRQILMYAEDEKDVKVRIEDLHFKKNQWEKE